MTSRYSFLPGALTMAGAVALGAAGCSTIPPPTVQMTVAKASVEAANAAGAQAYAPTELRLANDKLATAEKAMVDKNYSVAQRLAEQAQTDAQLAVSKTQSIKARLVANDAQAAARSWHDELDRNALRTAPGGPQ
ncbi:DUF4398 domain-containing protein [Piscinibacter terrae]|nr:DUF4398 domain-containing protein [Albitalea terrae]